MVLEQDSLSGDAAGPLKRPDFVLDCGNYDCAAGCLADSSIGVWHRRIEIDRVSRIQLFLFCSNAHFEFAAQYGQELDAGMMMWTGLSGRQRLKFGLVGV